jgi:hypothetical protein
MKETFDGMLVHLNDGARMVGASTKQIIAALQYSYAGGSFISDTGEVFILCDDKYCTVTEPHLILVETNYWGTEKKALLVDHDGTPIVEVDIV